MLSLPNMANDDDDAEFVKACDAITHARVQECLDLILSDPRHAGQTLLLVMHGASSKATVKYLSGGTVVTTTVCSYAAFDRNDSGGGGAAGGGSGGGGSGGGAAAAATGGGGGSAVSNEGAWNLLTGDEKLRDDYLQARGSSVGVEGAGVAG